MRLKAKNLSVAPAIYNISATGCIKFKVYTFDMVEEMGLSYMF